MEPPAPIFLPRQMEIKIYGIWQQLIEQRAQAPEGAEGVGGINMIIAQKAMGTGQPPMLVAQKLEQFLRFRAVVDGYRILSQKAAMQAQAQMMPPPEAPGSTEGPNPEQTQEVG
jgi:hypothetical protein